MKIQHALCITLLCTLTAACGKKEAPPAAPGTLTEVQKAELARRLVAPIDPKEFQPLTRGGSGFKPVPPIHPPRNGDKKPD